ncbi:MAG: HEPN domain-containing protein [Candidatus Micrarchaeota archaeon]
MNITDCLEQGLLAKIKADPAKAKSSLEMAKHKLELSQTEFEHVIFEGAIINAYASMFHTARALLFKDGFKERSHFAVYVFVSKKYSDKIERKYLSEFNSLRLTRHELMYGLEKNAEVRESNADTAIKMAEGFLEVVQKIVNKK